MGEDIGVSIPLYPNEHFYIITEPLDKLPKNSTSFERLQFLSLFKRGCWQNVSWNI